MDPVSVALAGATRWLTISAFGGFVDDLVTVVSHRHVGPEVAFPTVLDGLMRAASGSRSPGPWRWSAGSRSGSRRWSGPGWTRGGTSLPLGTASQAFLVATC